MLIFRIISGTPNLSKISHENEILSQKGFDRTPSESAPAHAWLSSHVRKARTGSYMYYLTACVGFLDRTNNIIFL